VTAPSEFVTVPEAAERLGEVHNTVERWLLRAAPGIARRPRQEVAHPHIRSRPPCARAEGFRINLPSAPLCIGKIGGHYLHPESRAVLINAFDDLPDFRLVLIPAMLSRPCLNAGHPVALLDSSGEGKLRIHIGALELVSWPSGRVRFHAELDLAGKFEVPTLDVRGLSFSELERAKSALNDVVKKSRKPGTFRLGIRGPLSDASEQTA
jgi:hypothetical protein